MSLCEIPVPLHRVGAYPDNLCMWFAEFLKAIPEGTNLSSAARCLLRRLTIQRRPSEPPTKGASDGPSAAHSHPRLSALSRMLPRLQTSLPRPGAESETGKIAERSQPRRLTPGPPFSPVSLEPYLLPKHNVVSRRTNGCSELYDVSAHGVVFDRDILGVWPVRTSRVGDTDPDLISISAEGVLSHPGVRRDASVVYRDTAAH